MTYIFFYSWWQWMQWHRGGSLLLASDADGIVWMWKIPSGSCSTFDFSGVAATICHFLPLNTMLAAGYGNGVVKIWNLTSPSQQMPTFSGEDVHLLLWSANISPFVICYLEFYLTFLVNMFVKIMYGVWEHNVCGVFR